MAHWLAAASALTLLAVSPALAQTEQELELGGGWMQFNPLGVSDVGGPTGLTVDLAWTRWLNERTGVAVGVTSIFGSEGYTSGLSALPHIYGHVTWRRRWMNADGRGYLHVGFGAGPMFWRRDDVGYSKYYLQPTVMWHVELMGTRTLRDGLDLRAGVSTTPWFHVPLTVHPTVKAVWTFGD